MRGNIEDLIVFNGINGATGTYALPPMSTAEFSEQIVNYARGGSYRQHLVADESERQHQLDKERRTRQRHAEHLGLIPGIDAMQLSQAGWGVIFAQEDRRAGEIREALRALLQLRREQAGDRFREYLGELGYRSDETKNQFLARHGMGPGPADPKKVPYYLLIVGSPEHIPYRFQYQLDVQYAVGRIHFASLQEYENYARSVVAADFERGQVKRDHRAAFFGVRNPDDPNTFYSAHYLVKKLAESMAAENPGWRVETLLEGQACKENLRGLLAGPARPALLFTASHGMEYPPGHERQLTDQGALLCSDWPGPLAWQGQGAVPESHYFAGRDVGAEAELLGLISFHFACYGAGTPRLDDFAQRSAQEAVDLAPQSFLAGLPQRLLGHPNGGALAAIGHVDRAWAFSFLWEELWEQTGQPNLTVFESTFQRLMAGEPVGYALEYFNERYAELSTMLHEEREGELFKISRGKLVNDESRQRALIHLWTANNDARGYIIVGDPAVRLALADDGQAEPAQPSITLLPSVEEPPLVPASVEEPPLVPPSAEEPPLVPPSGRPARNRLQAALQQLGERLETRLQATASQKTRLETTVYVHETLNRWAIHFDLHTSEDAEQETTLLAAVAVLEELIERLE